MKKFIFDVDDTLYDMMDPFVRAFRRLYGAEHSNLDMRKMFVLSRKYSDKVFEDTLNGTMSMKDMYIYRIQHAAADMGIVMTDEEAYQYQLYYQEYQNQITLPDTIAQLLDTLKQQQYTLGIITNGPSEHQRDKIRALGLMKWIPEECIVVSGDYEVSKPDPELFRIAAGKIGGRTEDFVYIGDSPVNDILGPSRAGWKTVWINRRNMINESGAVPNFTVHDNTELYALLTKKELWN